MSHAKHFDRIAIVVIAIAVLFAGIFLNATQSNDIQAPWLPKLAAKDNSEVILSAGAADAEYSDALALQYARQYSNWDPEIAEVFVATSDALAFQYARQYGNWEPKTAAASVDYSDALALQYARQYGNWDQSK